MATDSEDYVTALLVTADDPGSRRCIEIDQGMAHADYQMRSALDLQAEAIREKLVAHPLRRLPGDLSAARLDVRAQRCRSTKYGLAPGHAEGRGLGCRWRGELAIAARRAAVVRGG